MEDDTKYYIYDNNCFSVVFMNTKGLTINEINKIFGEWGNVSIVLRTGDRYGVHFVKYKREADAKQCINGIINHPTIRLLTHSELNWPKDDRSSSTEAKQSKSGLSKFRKTMPTAQRRHSLCFPPQSSPNPLKKTIKDSEKRTSLRFPTILTKNRSPTRATKSFGSSIPPTREKKTPYRGVTLQSPRSYPSFTILSPVSSNASRSSPSPRRLSFVKRDSPSPRLQRFKDSECKETISPDGKSLKIPDLVVVNDEGNMVSLEQSPQNSKNPVTISESVIECSVVVVANIPRGYNQYTILHMFRDYDPISVTSMRLVKGTQIRYCLVYFRSFYNAALVESSFDNLEMGSNRLIILTRESLALNTETKNESWFFK